MTTSATASTSVSAHPQAPANGSDVPVHPPSSVPAAQRRPLSAASETLTIVPGNAREANAEKARCS
jgi:hypothetical protein